MRKAGLAASVLATVCTGLMAGLILTYFIAVMPGLAATDDSTFVDAFQQIDHALDETLLFWIGIFMGGLLLILLSLFVNRRLQMRSTLPWLGVAAVLYAATVAITAFGIDPLENAIARLGDLDGLDPAQVRADLDEDRWALLNAVRLVTNVAAFACLAWSLVLSGRSVTPTGETVSKGVVAE